MPAKGKIRQASFQVTEPSFTRRETRTQKQHLNTTTAWQMHKLNNVDLPLQFQTCSRVPPEIADNILAGQPRHFCCFQSTPRLSTSLRLQPSSALPLYRLSACSIRLGSRITLMPKLKAVLSLLWLDLLWTALGTTSHATGDIGRELGYMGP